jgi:hypothetical protein
MLHTVRLKACATCRGSIGSHRIMVPIVLVVVLVPTSVATVVTAPNVVVPRVLSASIHLSTQLTGGVYIVVKGGTLSSMTERRDVVKTVLWEYSLALFEGPASGILLLLHAEDRDQAVYRKAKNLSPVNLTTYMAKLCRRSG